MVEAFKDEDIEHLIKRFRLECDRAGIVKELRDREYYRSPSQKRHQKNCDMKHRLKLAKLRRDA